jgi:hypothetical protein
MFACCIFLEMCTGRSHRSEAPAQLVTGYVTNADRCRSLYAKRRILKFTGGEFRERPAAEKGGLVRK